MYYIGFENGLFCMGPAQAAHNIFINFKNNPGTCLDGLIPYDPRCRSWYPETVNSTFEGHMTTPYVSATQNVILSS